MDGSAHTECRLFLFLSDLEKFHDCCSSESFCTVLSFFILLFIYLNTFRITLHSAVLMFSFKFFFLLVWRTAT